MFLMDAWEHVCTLVLWSQRHALANLAFRRDTAFKCEARAFANPSRTRRGKEFSEPTRVGGDIVSEGGGGWLLVDTQSVTPGTGLFMCVGKVQAVGSEQTWCPVFLPLSNPIIYPEPRNRWAWQVSGPMPDLNSSPYYMWLVIPGCLYPIHSMYYIQVRIPSPWCCRYRSLPSHPPRLGRRRTPNRVGKWTSSMVVRWLVFAIETFEFYECFWSLSLKVYTGAISWHSWLRPYIHILDSDAPVRQLRRCSNPRHLCAPPLYPHLFCRPRPNVKVWQMIRHEG